jgi:hypothetical protein
VFSSEPLSSPLIREYTESYHAESFCKTISFLPMDPAQLYVFLQCVIPQFAHEAELSMARILLSLRQGAYRRVLEKIAHKQQLQTTEWAIFIPNVAQDMIHGIEQEL